MIWLDGIHFPEHMRVAIVGAGPAGLGIARVLRDLLIPDVWVLERGKIGQSFLDWPTDTHLLTPSFPSNVFGLTDLNAISFDSSPGWSLKSEHPNGPQYASYLEHAATEFGINVQCGVTVQELQPGKKGFTIETDQGKFTADFVIWACGQFSSPCEVSLPGGELGRHYSQVRQWSQVQGDKVFVIGGFESGIDAAIGLAEAGKEVVVLDSGAPWLDGHKDPSLRLSPYTLQRLEAALQHLNISLHPQTEVTALEEVTNGTHILTADGRTWFTSNQPILATGFNSGTLQVSEWFDYDHSGLPILTYEDESSITPGLFLVGPEVSHNGHLFCFIYKFRQRFAVVARAIAGYMEIDAMPLLTYYDNNMFLDDLKCCDDDKCLC